MIEWQRGGWTGSLNRWVSREVREQLRNNPVAQRARPPKHRRTLRRFFSIGSFGRFVAIYFVIDVLVLTAELLIAWLVPGWLQRWTASGPPITQGLESSLLSVSGYLIAAQVGLVMVIAIALALITIIAQRESSSTDVQVYYHESLSFEVVASCMALVAVLCAQLLWPLQSLLHWLGGGTDLLVFKLMLLGVHVVWLLVNITGLAHFVAITFRFVQQSAREELREQYTVEVVQPAEMTNRLREQLYMQAGSEILGEADDEDEPSGQPEVDLGFNFSKMETVEIETNFTRPMVLHDLRVIWVRWVARRWATRCEAAAAKQPSRPQLGLIRDRPLLIFTPKLDQPLLGSVAWCGRTGGVPLSRLERLVLRLAFRFRRQRNEA